MAEIIIYIITNLTIHTDALAVATVTATGIDNVYSITTTNIHSNNNITLLLLLLLLLL